jgi:hypothetical protein
MASPQELQEEMNQWHRGITRLIQIHPGLIGLLHFLIACRLQQPRLKEPLFLHDLKPPWMILPRSLNVLVIDMQRLVVKGPILPVLDYPVPTPRATHLLAPRVARGPIRLALVLQLGTGTEVLAQV